MFNKKLLSLSILATLGVAGLAGCNGASAGGNSGQSVPAASSEPEASSADSSEGTAATSIKWTAPAVSVIGDIIDFDKVAEIAPEGATAYTIEATSGKDFITINGHVVTCVAAGTAKIRATAINASGRKITLAGWTLNIYSEEAAKVQAVVSAMKNDYAVIGTETVWSNKTLDTITPTDVPSEAALATIAIGPKYMIDWCYGELSGVELKADGNFYGFTDAYNEAGTSVTEGIESLGDVADAMTSIVSVDLGGRADDYRSYFDHSTAPAFNVSKLTEVEDEETGATYFSFKDAAQAAEVVGGLYFMETSGWKNTTGYLMFDDEGGVDKVYYEVLFEETDRSGKPYVAMISGYIINQLDMTGLNTFADTARAPEGEDVSALVDAFATLASNYTVDWEVGCFAKDDARSPIALPDKGYDYFHGRSLVSEDKILSAYIAADAETGEYDWNAAEFSDGLKFADGGIYEMEVNEEDKIVPVGDKTEVSDASLYDLRNRAGLFANGLLDADCLNGATLSKDEENPLHFIYNAKFDEATLGAILCTFTAIGYTDFATPENAQYEEGAITVLENGDIYAEFFMRVRFDEAGTVTGYQGYKMLFTNIGTTDTSDDKTFAELFGIVKPDAGESSGEGSSVEEEGGDASAE